MIDLYKKSINHEGLHIHMVKTKKFKTITILFMIKVPLEEKFITEKALIPYILLGGSRNYPGRKQLKQKLEWMYGTRIIPDVQKKGDTHILSFRMEVPSDQFLRGDTTLFDESIHLLHEVVFHPALYNGVFPVEIVEEEKRNLRKKHISLFHEKMIFSHCRLIEEMFRGEPYGLLAIGKYRDIDSISATTVYQVYDQIIKQGQLELFIVGDLKEEAEKFICEVFNGQYQPSHFSDENPVPLEDKNPRNVEDVLDVKQGKLLMGFRTNTRIQDEEYEALKVANAIFGRFPTSKLFRSVREKEGLAYFAHSQLEGSKGLLIAMVGINPINYERTVSLIKDELNAMQEGTFSEDEINQAKKMLINLLKEAYDSPLGMMDMTIQSLESGAPFTIQDQIDRIYKVTKEDIIRSACKWTLDTVYFLNGQKKEGG